MTTESIGENITHTDSFLAETPEQTFEFAEKFGEKLRAGDVVLMYGDLGAGKTLFTKGVLSALNYDVDEVTSPSFTLVNLYKTADFNVYHIDFWRLDENSDLFSAVGMEEILDDEKAIVIIEWSERLKHSEFERKVHRVFLEGDGNEPRKIEISF